MKTWNFSAKFYLAGAINYLDKVVFLEYTYIMTLWIDQKYVGMISPRLDRFKKKSDKLYNFRCPFCGDSEKDLRKARGYLYVVGDRIAFKCHNCHLPAPFYKFLKHIDPSVANAWKLETFGEPKNTTREATELVVPKSREPISNPLYAIGADKMQEMDQEHPAVQYLYSRKIPLIYWNDLYYIKDYRRLAEINPAYEGRLLEEARIIIPFRDKDGRMTGVQGRAMGNNPMRYVTVRFTDDPLIFGYQYIDPEKMVFATEGAFDSMFVNNGLAVAGSNLKGITQYVPKDNLALVYDNEPRNKDIVRIMERAIKDGFRLVIWPPTWQFKDINEAILGGVSQKELMETLYTHAYGDLQVKLAIRDWKR